MPKKYRLANGELVNVEDKYIKAFEGSNDFKDSQEIKVTPKVDAGKLNGATAKSAVAAPTINQKADKKKNTVSGSASTFWDTPESSVKPLLSFEEFTRQPKPKPTNTASIGVITPGVNDFGSQFDPNKKVEGFKEFGLTPAGKKQQIALKQKEADQQEEERLRGIQRYRNTVLRNEPKYKEVSNLMAKANIVPKEFEEELDNDIKSQLDKNGKEQAASFATGGSFGMGVPQTYAKSNFVAFPKERKLVIESFKKQNKPYTESEVLNASKDLYRNNKIEAQQYNQKYDGFETLDGYDDDIKDFLKEYKVDSKKINDIDLAKITVRKGYMQGLVENKAKDQEILEKQLKPKDYKFSTQEEVDKENLLVYQINQGRKSLKGDYDHYNELVLKQDKLQDTSTTLAEDIELHNKEWGWWAKTGLKTWGSAQSFGGSIAGGAAWLTDLGVNAATGGDWGNEFGEIVSEKAKKNQDILDKNLPKARDNFYSIESFGENAASAILNTAPFIAAVVLAPESLAPEAMGFITGAVSGTGSKYNEMLQEQKYGTYDEFGNKTMPNYDLAQLTAVPALFGLFEGGTEYVGGRAIGRAQKIFGKATKVETDALLTGTKKAIGEKAKEFSLNLLQNYGEEIPSEVANQILGNVTDKILLGKTDTNVFDGLSDVVFDTSVVSTLFGTAPHIAGAMYKQFIPPTQIEELINNNKKVADILNGVDYKNLSKEEKSVIDVSIKDLKEESTAIINNVAGMIGTTSARDLLNINNSSKKVIDIRKQAEIINNSTKLNTEQKKAAIDGLRTKFDQVNQQYRISLTKAYAQEKYFNKVNTFFNRKKLNKDINLGTGFAEIIKEHPDAKFKYGSGAEIVDMMLNDKKTSSEIEEIAKTIEDQDVAAGAEKYSAEQKLFTKKAIASERVNANGWFNPTTKDIYVNKDKSLIEGRYTTARHEFFHKFAQRFSNNMSEIGSSLYNIARDLHAGNKDFESTDFAKRMNQEINDAKRQLSELSSKKANTLKNLTAKLNNNQIDDKQFNDAEKIINKNFEDSSKIINNRAYEEALSILTESLDAKDIVIDKANIGEIKTDANGNVIINNGQDALNLVVAYNEAFSKTKGSEAISAAYKGKVVGELIKNKPGEVVDDLSQQSKGIQDMAKAIDSNIEGTGVKTNEEFRTSSKTAGWFFEIEENKQFESYLKGLITADKNLGGLEAEVRDDILRQLKERIQDRVLKNYSPVIDGKPRSLFSYIYGKGESKGTGGIAYMSILDIKKKYATSTDNISINRADGTTSDFADEGMTTEELVDLGLASKTEAEKSKLRRELKLNDGKTGIDEELITKIKDEVDTSLNEIGLLPSDKDFRKQLIEKYKAKLKEPIAKLMGGAGAYKGFLENNKETLIENLPVAYFVQIERLKPADERIFTAPVKRLTTQAEIDKYTALGLTYTESDASGPWLYKKYMPSDQEFADFYGVSEGSKLGSTKGTRKDELARAIGITLASDMTPTVLREKEQSGEISTADKNKIAERIQRDPELQFSKPLREALGLDSKAIDFRSQKQIQNGREGLVKLMQSLKKNGVGADDLANYFIGTARGTYGIDRIFGDNNEFDPSLHYRTDVNSEGKRKTQRYLTTGATDFFRLLTEVYGKGSVSYAPKATTVYIQGRGKGLRKGKTIKLDAAPTQTASGFDSNSMFNDGTNSIENRNAYAYKQQANLKVIITEMKKMYEANELSGNQVGMILATLYSSGKSIARTAAPVKWFAKIKNLGTGRNYIYEHYQSVSSTILEVAKYIGSKNKPYNNTLDQIFDGFGIAVIDEDYDTILNEDTPWKSTGPKDENKNLILGTENDIQRYNSDEFKNAVEVKGLPPMVLIPIADYGKVKEQDEIANINNAVVYSTQIQKSKGISVMDFDDTLGLTSGSVLYTMPDGSTGKLNAEEFAKNGADMLDDGAKFDFSEFSEVVDGKPGPMIQKALKLASKFGTKDMYVLTARPANAAPAIKEFLDSLGLNIPLENITGLGNSTAQAKADWIVGKAAEGYNDFYFTDDAIQNVTAVKNALNVLDVKSKIQQARLQFSKGLSTEFNKIISQNKGIASYKEYSDIVARRKGAGKNRFDFYVPASAADFELLLYNFIGKGAIGEEQKVFFNNALLKPYANGLDLMDAARQSIKKEYKELLKLFPGIKKSLEELTPDGEFTYDQAVRVAIWEQFGIEIPGLSKRDKTKLVALVNSDANLTAFKDGLIQTGRQGKGWVEPYDNWDASTIISDLHNLTEGAGRKKFLGEFIENIQEMFGKFENGKLVGPNINKIEAVYGTNVREALDDQLYRMINGKNRSYGGDKETSAWSNWVNGSTGAIMFLNTRSAVLQLLGAVNFLNLRDNNPIAAGIAFANQKQYWEDFARIWNSDKMKERRGGLKEDVAAAEIANAASSSKNKPAAVIAFLLKIGYTPTQLADSFAIASGGSPFYRNRIKFYLKEGLTESEAETAAWSDFTKVSDETQQSADPRDISKQQASPAGRLLLTFQNFSMQQSRIVKKSFLDLKNGRGNAKTHVTKIIYYLAVQNILFATLQQGLFALGFDDDDEEKDPEKDKAKALTNEKKIFSVINGVMDSILRGTGFVGGVVSVLKNMTLKYLDEKDKNFKADYTKVLLEGANISPPIGSKLRKVYTGLQQTKFEKDLIAERGWGVMQDGRVHLGPMYGVSGKLIEAGTNIPMDRIVNKIENVSQALNSQNQAWQRVSVGLGFTPYSVGIEESKGDLDIRAKAKANRKKEGAIKSKATREATKKAKKEAYEALPQAKKDSISLSEYLLKEKKARDKFIEKAVEEANMTPDELVLKKYLEKEKRKANKGKYKENKIRNQKIRDSINLDVFLKKSAK